MLASNVPAGHPVQGTEMTCDDRTRPNSAGVILAGTDEVYRLDLIEPTVDPVENGLGSADAGVGNDLCIGAGAGVNAEIVDSIDSGGLHPMVAERTLLPLGMACHAEGQVDTADASPAPTHPQARQLSVLEVLEANVAASAGFKAASLLAPCHAAAHGATCACPAASPSPAQGRIWANTLSALKLQKRWGAMRKQNKRSAVGSVLEAQLRAELLPFDFSTMSATRVPAALVSVDCTDSLPETTEAVDKAQPLAAHDENDAPQEVYRVLYLPVQLVFRDSWFHATPNNVHLFVHSLGRTDVGTCHQISLECKVTLRIINIT